MAKPALATQLLPTLSPAVFITYSTGIASNETQRVKRKNVPAPAYQANEFATTPALESRIRPTPVKTKGVSLVRLPKA